MVLVLSRLSRQHPVPTESESPGEEPTNLHLKQVPQVVCVRKVSMFGKPCTNMFTGVISAVRYKL